MKNFIGFEIGKLLRRPIAWISLAFLTLFAVYELFQWVIPTNITVQEERNGEIITLKGFEAVRRNQEITALYKGAMTTDKAQSIVETYAFSADAMEKSGMDPQNQRKYTHNYLYTVTAPLFANPDGSYNGSTLEDSFDQELARNLVLGYSEGWSRTLTALPGIFSVWACVLAVILSPVFSEEYTRRTDALILTGYRGRSRCPAAKIAAAYIISLGGSLILLALILLCHGVCYGYAGLECSVQLSRFLPMPLYSLSMGQAFALVLLLLSAAILVFTALLLAISAFMKSPFSSLILGAAVLLAPSAIPMDSSLSSTVYVICSLLPINQLKIAALIYLPGRLPFDLTEVQVMLLSVPIVIIVTAISIPCAGRAFARHRVT